MIKLILSLFVFQIVFFNARAQNIVVEGVLVDSLTRESIPYVNIGIPTKNVGTTTSLAGIFQLNIPLNYKDEKLVFSHVGYFKKKISISEADTPDTIFLKPKENILNELVVLRKRSKTSTIGVKSYSPFLWGTTQNRQGDIVELAQKINCPDGEVRLEKAKIYVRSVYGDSAVVRINFYKDSGNGPGELLVNQQLLEKRRIREGWQVFDLTKYHIFLKEDFYISFEFLPQPAKPLIITTGGKLFRGNGYARTSSLGRWSKSGGAYAIHLEVSK